MSRVRAAVIAALVPLSAGAIALASPTDASDVVTCHVTCEGRGLDLDGERLDVTGVDRVACDDMGGAYVGDVCQDVDY